MFDTPSDNTFRQIPVTVPLVPLPASSPVVSQTVNAPPAVAPQPIPWVQPPRSTVWDIPFDQLTLNESVEKIAELIRRGVPSYVITANLNYVMLHHRDESLGKVTDQASLILADGQPIVARSRLGTKPLPQRVAGSELIYYLASRAAMEGWGIYFLGGAPGVAASCANKLAETFPGMQIAGVESPPFRALNEEEQREQDDRIRRSGAKLLLVAFGQPKGEQWIYDNYQRLGVPVSIQLGASFDFIAGTATRAPEIFQKYGLEWSYRMLSDPQRLVPRYWSNAMFLLSALIQDWKRAVTKWGMGDWA